MYKKSHQKNGSSLKFWYLRELCQSIHLLPMLRLLSRCTVFSQNSERCFFQGESHIVLLAEFVLHFVFKFCPSKFLGLCPSKDSRLDFWQMLFLWWLPVTIGLFKVFLSFSLRLVFLADLLSVLWIQNRHGCCLFAIYLLSNIYLKIFWQELQIQNLKSSNSILVFRFLCNSAFCIHQIKTRYGPSYPPICLSACPLPLTTEPIRSEFWGRAVPYVQGDP